MTTLAGDAAYEHRHDCGCGHATDHDAEDRGGSVGAVVYRGLLGDRVRDLERQMADPTLVSVPGHRGWVLANVLSFLEGGHYGADYTTGQGDVVRESRVHLRGAAFGMRVIGGSPRATWRWFVPVAGSLSDAELAAGFALRAKTAEVWGPDARPRSAEDVDREGGEDEVDDGVPAAEDEGDPAAEDVPGDHAQRAQQLWDQLYGTDQVLKDVVILDYARVPSEPVRKFGYDAWTNSTTRVYVAKGATREPIKHETTLRHEAVHVRQFRAKGRPDTYTKAIEYELEAYREGVPRLEARESRLKGLTNRSALERRELATVTGLLDSIEATIAKLEKAVEVAATRTRPGVGRECWYKDYLVSKALAPPHVTLEDLYDPPKEQRNRAAAEREDTLEAGHSPEAKDAPEDEDALVEVVVHELAGTPVVAPDAPDEESVETDSAEFVGSEHKEIGDAGSGNESSSIPHGSPARPLSFGDVVSLAGDYYETYEQMRDLDR